jgi:hypothetical protein
MKTKRKFCSLTNTVTKMPTVLVFTKVKHFISIVAKYYFANVFSISAEFISDMGVNCIRLAQFVCSNLIGFRGSFLRKYKKNLAQNDP